MQFNGLIPQLKTTGASKEKTYKNTPSPIDIPKSVCNFCISN